MTFPEEMKKVSEEAGFRLSEEQLQSLSTYYEMLIDWNQRMNLTAITEPGEVAVKHMIDSLSAYDEKRFSGAPRLIDIGTGAGFPGLPLKILVPGLRLTLMDSLGKRVHFLEAVCERLHLTDVRCIHARAEEAARQKEYRGRFDLATSRAVARLPILLEYAVPFLKVGGTFLALKGRDYAAEAEESAHALKVLGAEIESIRPVRLPGLEDRRAILAIRKLAPTPRAYPRKAGTPAKKPL